MITRHNDKSMVLIIAESFHNQSEGELKHVFYSMEKGQIIKIILFIGLCSYS